MNWRNAGGGQRSRKRETAETDRRSSFGHLEGPHHASLHFRYDNQNGNLSISGGGSSGVGSDDPFALHQQRNLFARTYFECLRRFGPAAFRGADTTRADRGGRSEERRVGKEGRSRGATEQEKERRKR